MSLADENTSRMNLVGVPSSAAAGRVRVIAGDPDNSYLIEKLGPNPAVGAQMPFGRPPLPQADIDVIRTWIANGAVD